MKMRLLTLSLASAGLLVACGGGGSTSSDNGSITTGTVTLTGVVASYGAVMPSTSVAIKCAAGSGTATTDATTGAYTVALRDAALPCVLKANGSSLVMHSVAPGSGTDKTVTVNISPLTELLVAQLTGADPASFMETVTTAQLTGLVTTSKVQAAETSVLETLLTAGVATGGVSDLISGALSFSGSGNHYAVALGNLSSTLTSTGTTLTGLTDTVAATAASTSAAGSSTATASSATPSLPADLLLKPKAATCAALRSTTYRVVQFKPSVTTGATDPVTATNTMTFDAATLTATWNDDGSTEVWTPVAGDTCRFTNPDGVDIAISPAGVAVARTSETGAGTTVYRLALAFPEQSHALADLAGTWNTIGWETVSTGAALDATAGTFVMTGAGAITSARCFDQPIGTADGSCTGQTTGLPNVSASSAGGFDLIGLDATDPWRDRGFFYRAGNGDLMMVSLNASGEFMLATRMRTLTLPTVGAVTSHWNYELSTANQSVTPAYLTGNTVLSTDIGTGRWTRTAWNVAPAVTYPQTLEINKARNGYAHRLAATGVTQSDGSTRNVREFYSLTMRGMGISPVYLPNTSTTTSVNQLFLLSVQRPQ
jgi:hypothetical protein